MKKSTLIILTACVFVVTATAVSVSHARLKSPVDVDDGGGKGTRFVQVCFNGHCVRAELAVSEASRQKGLMGRDTLGKSEGMLFVFPREETHSFWMKNMRFPLDMIWMSSDGTVTAVTSDAMPCTLTECPSFTDGGDTRFVLEVNAGFSRACGIAAGTKAILPPEVMELPEGQ